MESRQSDTEGYTPRRRILQAVGGIGILGIAGCLGDDDADDSTDEADDDDTDDDDDDPVPASFEVAAIDPDELHLAPGEAFDLTATIENTGDEEGGQAVTVWVAEEEIGSQLLTLPGQASEEIAFAELTPGDLDPGTHGFSVRTDDDEATGTIEISTPPFSVVDEENEYVEVSSQNGPVARFMYAFDEDVFDPNGLDDVSEAYLNVLDPDSGQVLTGYPGQAGGHPHQRGIFVTWGCLGVDGTQHDFWHMDSGELIVHRDFHGSLDTFPQHQTIVSEIEWITPSGEVVVIEERRMTFLPPAEPDGLVQIDLETTLEATGNEVHLDFCHGMDNAGAEPYGGIRWRSNYRVADDNSASFLFPEGAFDDDDPDVMTIREKENLEWAVQTFPLDGEQYIVQQMDHPDNDFDTRWSAYREYGLLGTFFEETIQPGDSLTASVSFSVWRGETPDDDTFEAVYDEFVDRT